VYFSSKDITVETLYNKGSGNCSAIFEDKKEEFKTEESSITKLVSKAVNEKRKQKIKNTRLELLLETNIRLFFQYHNILQESELRILYYCRVEL
jgi:hypothetical protein